MIALGESLQIGQAGEGGAAIVLMIHDELVIEVQEHKLQQASRRWGLAGRQPLSPPSLLQLCAAAACGGSSRRFHSSVFCLPRAPSACAGGRHRPRVHGGRACTQASSERAACREDEHGAQLGGFEGGGAAAPVAAATAARAAAAALPA